jgi:hypothetical protein
MRLSEEEGVIIATLNEDDFLQYLEWPKYPESKPNRRWVKAGTIEAWLASQSPGTGSRAAVRNAGKPAEHSRKRAK